MAHPFGPEASFDSGYSPSPDINTVLDPEQQAAAQREVREGFGDSSVVADTGAHDLSRQQQAEIARFLREELL